MPAIVRNFTDPLEKELYWDDSFTIAAYEPHHALHPICRQFTYRLRQEKVISFVSDWTLNEFAFYLIRRHLEQEAKVHGLYWQEFFRRHPDAIQPALRRVRVALSQLTAFTVWLPSLGTNFCDLILEPQLRQLLQHQSVKNFLRAVAPTAWQTFAASTFDDAFWLMERFNLLPTDAFHIAIAQFFGIKAIVSLDLDFIRVDGIIVYAP
jgi:predicted nucleic acid-binding protein